MTRIHVPPTTARRAAASPVPSYLHSAELDRLLTVQKSSPANDVPDVISALRHAPALTPQLAAKAQAAAAPTLSTSVRNQPISSTVAPALQISLQDTTAFQHLTPGTAPQVIQDTWTAFQQFAPNERRMLLQGLLQRCSAPQLDEVQTLLAQSRAAQHPRRPPATPKSRPQPRPARAQLVSTPPSFPANPPEPEPAAHNMYARLFNPSFDAKTLESQLQHLAPSQTADVLQAIVAHSERQRRVLQLVADAGESANAQAQERLEQTQRAPHDSTPRDLSDRLLAQVLAAAGDVCHSAHATLYLLDPNTNALFVRASTWLGPPGRTVALDAVLCGKSAVMGNSVNVYNVRSSEEYTSACAEHYRALPGSSVECVLSVPVLSPSRSRRVLGILEMCNKTSGAPYFGSESHEFATVVSRVVSLLVLGMDIYSLGVQPSVRSVPLAASGTAASTAVGTLVKANSTPVPEQRDPSLRLLAGTTAIAGLDLDLQSLIDVLVEQSMQLVGAERAAVFIVDPERRELWSSVARGETVTIRFPMNRGIAGYVACTGELTNIPDAYLDERFNPDIDRKTGYRTQTILCAPMVTSTREVIGVVQMLNKLPRGLCFSKDDEAILSSFTVSAAAAMDKALKFRELRRQCDSAAAENRRLSAILAAEPCTRLTLSLDGRLESADNPAALHLDSGDLERLRTLRFTEWVSVPLGTAAAPAGWDDRELSRAHTAHFVQLVSSFVSAVETPRETIVSGAPIDAIIGARKPRAESLPGLVVDYAVSQCVGPPEEPKGAKVLVTLRIRTDAEDKRTALTRALPAAPAAVARLTSPECAAQLAGAVRTASILHARLHDGDGPLPFLYMNSAALATGQYTPARVQVEPLDRFVQLVDAAVRGTAPTGIVDRVLGEGGAVAALFGAGDAPETSAAAAACDAVAAGLVAVSLAADATTETEPFHLSLAVASGPVVSGLVGSRRCWFTAAGAPYRSASALAQLARMYGARLVVDEATYQLTKRQFLFRELDRVQLEPLPAPDAARALAFCPGLAAALPQSASGLVGVPEGHVSPAAAAPHVGSSSLSSGSRLRVGLGPRLSVAGIPAATRRASQLVTADGVQHPTAVPHSTLNTTGDFPAAATAAATIYEVVGVAGHDVSQDMTTSHLCFELGLKEYRRGNWEQALAQFQKASLLVSDPPSKVFAERCELVLEQLRAAAPSGKDPVSSTAPWDGVWVYYAGR